MSAHAPQSPSDSRHMPSASSSYVLTAYSTPRADALTLEVTSRLMLASLMALMALVALPGVSSAQETTAKAALTQAKTAPTQAKTAPTQAETAQTEPRDPNAELEPADAFVHLLAQTRTLIAARRTGEALTLKFTYRQLKPISDALLTWVKRGDTEAQITTKLRARIYTLFSTPRMESWATKHINYISDELKSPFCPGKTLLTCTSPNAFTLRAEMRRELLQGYKDDEILSKLRERFGQLENPPQPWYTILLPILPFVFGALIAIWVLSRWIGGGRAQAQLRDARAAEEDEDPLSESSAHHDRLQTLLRDDD